MLRVGQGLWITPCKQIHTFFMNFPIDVLFMDKHHTVLAIHRSMTPWRISRIVWRACSVLEIAGGALSQDTIVGHCLEFREQEGLIP